MGQKQTVDNMDDEAFGKIRRTAASTWLEKILFDYRQAVRRNILKLPARAYVNISQEADELLNFQPPSGLSLRLDSQLTPTFLRSANLEVLPTRRFGIGYIHSKPLSAGRPYFLYGRIFDSWRVEGYGTGKLCGNWQWTTAGWLDHITVSPASMNEAASHSSVGQARGQLQYEGEAWNHVVTYGSERHLFGYQCMFTPSFKIPVPGDGYRRRQVDTSIGGEIYYTGQENSGGLSIGTRIVIRDSHPEESRERTPIDTGLHSMVEERPLLSEDLTDPAGAAESLLEHPENSDPDSSETASVLLQSSQDLSREDASSVEKTAESDSPLSSQPSSSNTAEALPAPPTKLADLPAASAKTISPSPGPLIVTATVNPMMGHLRTTIVSSAYHPRLSAAARLYFNFHSHDSDLSLACRYISSDYTQVSQVRIGATQGLAVSLTSKIARLTVSFGFSASLFDRKVPSTIGMALSF